MNEAIAADPEGMLGAKTVGEFAARLPFLLKLLAADQPLSLQVHPTADTARRGFEAEEAAGIPVDAPERNYRDPHHKPELLVAVSDFEGLCGYRAPEETGVLLSKLQLPSLERIIGVIARDVGGSGITLATVTRALLAAPAERRAILAEEVSAAAARRVDTVPEPAATAYRLVTELSKYYPGDVGVLSPLLLNPVRLSPGEAIYIPPGTPHAYLRGVGIEIMAASDNVLRGGMTSKHVDASELLRVVDYSIYEEPVLQPTPVAPGVVEWPTPVREFRLRRFRVGGLYPTISLPTDGPQIVFCLSGRVRADDGAGEVLLGPGEAAFGAARDDGQLTLTGFGEVYQATTAV